MFIDDLRADLDEIDRLGLTRRRRALGSPCGPRVQRDGREYLSFCSNDYLGLAADPALRAAIADGAQQWGAGAGASHLVSGHYAAHDVLESALAAFCGCERAISFSTGYMANLAAVATLAGRGDAIFADRLNHASLVDGALLSRARLCRYPHTDLSQLARLLETTPARRRVIVSDTVFSMDGDLAPLPGLLDLAERHDALLILDDAHGLGVLGPEGRGSLAHFDLCSPRVVLIGTLGKAAGLAGAFIAGDGRVIEWLVQRARSYIFTTAAPPALAHALLTSLLLIRGADEARARLRQLIDRLRGGLSARRWRLADSATPIQPLIVGGNREALALSAALDEAGVWVPAIRPPTVPEGTARLRISLSAAHSYADVDRLLELLRGLEAAP
ncbi:MAG: 8-amino-7-oxononanoate synthase [Zoogloeaceae bacterium]|nr:8-amino-7-oxononanoate synthase [Rhodocyclaceae bacterium]MCP5235570.1 8-amino-7-oxononanoate synthase [Zoogloeaceae bacterium]